MTEAEDWVPVLGRVVFNRDVPATTGEIERYGVGSAVAPPAALPEDPGLAAAITMVVGLARNLREVQHLLDERPQGGWAARAVSKAPVVGVAGAWLAERKGMRRAADAVAEILADRAPGWHSDPYGRYDLRYWNGREWDVHVFHDGRQFIDELG